MKDERPTHLDLFSGIGGFALAAQWAGFRTIGFCEIDKYCRKVLAKNFLGNAKCKRWRESAIQGGLRLEQDSLYKTEREESSDSVERSTPIILSNIFDLDGRDFYGVTLITGGFPCQPFSVAGKRRGAADDRAIWPEMLRVIKEARSAWVLGENVPGIISMELDNVLSDLEGIGYATRSFVVPACAVDARHRRDRLWIVAKSNAERCGRWKDNEGQESTKRNGFAQAGDVADTKERTERPGLCEREPRGFGRRRSGNGSCSCCKWFPEPDVGRVAHGVRNRVDRLKGLGNAIVPQVAYEILREIRKLI